MARKLFFLIAFIFILVFPSLEFEGNPRVTHLNDQLIKQNEKRPESSGEQEHPESSGEQEHPQSSGEQDALVLKKPQRRLWQEKDMEESFRVLIDLPIEENEGKVEGEEEEEELEPVPRRRFPHMNQANPKIYNSFLGGVLPDSLVLGVLLVLKALFFKLILQSPLLLPADDISSDLKTQAIQLIRSSTLLPQVEGFSPDLLAQAVLSILKFLPDSLFQEFLSISRVQKVLLALLVKQTPPARVWIENSKFSKIVSDMPIGLYTKVKNALQLWNINNSLRVKNAPRVKNDPTVQNALTLLSALPFKLAHEVISVLPNPLFHEVLSALSALKAPLVQEVQLVEAIPLVQAVLLILSDLPDEIFQKILSDLQDELFQEMLSDSLAQSPLLAPEAPIFQAFLPLLPVFKKELFIPLLSTLPDSLVLVLQLVVKNPLIQKALPDKICEAVRLFVPDSLAPPDSQTASDSLDLPDSLAPPNPLALPDSQTASDSLDLPDSLAPPNPLALPDSQTASGIFPWFFTSTLKRFIKSGFSLCVFFYENTKACLGFVRNTMKTVFIKLALLSILYLIVFSLFTWEKFLNTIFDPFSTYVHDKLTKIKLLENLYESSTLKSAYKNFGVFISFFSQLILFLLGLLLADEPKSPKIDASAPKMGMPTKVERGPKNTAIINFLISYVGFWTISWLFPDNILACLQFFLGRGALKRAFLKPSMSTSIFLFSADTLRHLYNKKYLPGIFSFLKDFFGYSTPEDQHNLNVQFLTFIYFAILWIHMILVALRVFFDLMSSKVFVFEATLSVFFFLFYKYAPG